MNVKLAGKPAKVGADFICPDADLNSLCGWITPDGSFYGCQHYGHAALAERLLSQRIDWQPKNPELYAEKLGWVKIGYAQIPGRVFSPAASCVAIVLHDSRHPPTPNQLWAVWEWCLLHQQPAPAWFRRATAQTA